MCSQEVRRMEVIRLVGDRANPHNRMKKNRLCGLVFVWRRKNKEIVFRVFRVYRVNEKYTKYPIYPKYPRYIFAERSVTILSGIGVVMVLQ